MDKDEIEKCRNDMIYFMERYVGFELKWWQKCYLRLLKKT